MSEDVKKIDLFMFCFVFMVVCENMTWFGGGGVRFHTVNHVYFSAEKVQFALHFFPKQIVMFCGLHTRKNNNIYNQEKEQRRNFFIKYLL